MADDLNEVRPGDRITADLMNTLIRRVNTLGGTGPTGVQVPDVFGLAFSDAKQQLQAAGQFTVTAAYDPFGTALILTDAALLPRRVLSQLPPAGSRVPAGSTVRLVLSAEAVAGPAPGTEMTITAINPSIAPLRSEVQIFGTNFAANRADNIVMFNGVRAAAPSPQSTTTSLFVVIPDMEFTRTVAGLPTVLDSQEDEGDVFVTVITPTAHSPEKVMKVLPPLLRHLPTIQSSNDTTTSVSGVPKRAVTLSLSNYNEWFNTQQGQPTDVRLYFNGLPGGGVTPVPNLFPFSLTFTVPDIGLNTQVGSTVLIRLWVDGFLSPAFQHRFAQNL